MHETVARQCFIDAIDNVDILLRMLTGLSAVFCVAYGFRGLDRCQLI
ncbi:hypothetical protein [Streptosporangium sp. NBC_01756]|nr:hypothetical protein [Streptosporangium sp. NBC_01756]WSC89055.1 hypothetical protein OIE48_12935 [Streptosporangium sp. NBC_01756]